MDMCISIIICVLHQDSTTRWPLELKRELQRQEWHLFLLNDVLVVAKIKYNNFKMKNNVKWCVDSKLWRWSGSCHTDAMRSSVLGWPTVNSEATFSSQSRRTNDSLLQRHISLEKEKDNPKSIPLKIFTKVIGNCACSKTIAIRNSGTVNEVINTSLPTLGMTDSERDHQF